MSCIFEYIGYNERKMHKGVIFMTIEELRDSLLATPKNG